MSYAIRGDVHIQVYVFNRDILYMATICIYVETASFAMGPSSVSNSITNEMESQPLRRVDENSHPVPYYHSFLTATVTAFSNSTQTFSSVYLLFLFFHKSDHEVSLFEIFVLILWIWAGVQRIVSSLRPMLGLFLDILFLFLITFTSEILWRYFSDHTITPRCLLNQFFNGAIFLQLFILLARILVGAILYIASAYVWGYGFINKFSDEPDLSRPFPFIFVAILTIFLACASVEEVGKWLLARRYKKLNHYFQNSQPSRSMSSRGIILYACFGALGVITSQTLFFFLFCLNTSGVPAMFFPSYGLWGVLLFALLSIPVQISSQVYVAIAAAKTVVFHDPDCVMFALFVAVLFHGAFLTVAMIEGLVLWAGFQFPRNGALGAVVVQVVLVVSFLVLCRAKYNAVLERERVMLASLMEESTSEACD